MRLVFGAAQAQLAGGGDIVVGVDVLAAAPIVGARGGGAGRVGVGEGGGIGGRRASEQSY